MIDYLKENMKEGYEVELWLTWMDERIEQDKYYFDIENILIKDIKNVFDFSTFNKPRGIVILKRSIHEL
ncbi:hypothetical protein [Clostridium grantii]|uniref:Uncharacterized protein n=1 Tax=Clostridium grantii DSM 8605 TaxID=1121316 RepID=A0A1M5V3A8_9CLOT|nr:hypothetical protein [Clostridium grantii]SHH69757.1 hypothetical protein SAMN02745207_02044 [Clostridium grantii DSM 8605]